MLRKNGFTLVEVLIVIVLIGILLTLLTTVNFNRLLGSTYAERLVEKTSAVLTQARLDMISGRVIKNSLGVLQNPTAIKFTIHSGSTLPLDASWSVTYYSGSTLTFTGETMRAPFFDSDMFYIKHMWYFDKNNLPVPVAGVQDIVIVFDTITKQVTFEGAPVDAVVATIQMGYKENTKVIRLDRRTGKITVSAL